MKSEVYVLDEIRDVTLSAYIQEVGGEYHYVTKRPAVLILPGGGYQYCSEREANPVIFPYLEAGYHAFVLRYSVKEDSAWPNPLEDYEHAMELICSKAEEWALYPDKIAVIGFSAGGHLAACAASMSRNRPAAAILGYAVTMGDHVRSCNSSAPDVIAAVNKDTCPCFVFATRTDNVVPIENSLALLNALDRAGVSFESHIYAYGPHGFSTGNSAIQNRDSKLCPRASDWVSDSIGWLKDMLGDFGADGMTKPACNHFAMADNDAFLSLDCTIGHLMGNSEVSKLLMPLFSRGQSHGSAQAIESARHLRLRDALIYGHVSKEVMKSLEEQLSLIPNI